MHRALLAGIALALAARDVAAQQFQFMTPVPRPATSLLPGTSTAGGYVASGDVDGDGRSDLVTIVSGSASVFHHLATGWTQGQTMPWSPWAPRPVLIDLDADGDRDLVFVPPRLSLQTPVSVLQRTASAFATVPLPWASTTLLHAAALGDIDGDRFVDMILATIPGSATPSLVVARGGPGLQFTVDMAATPTTLPYGLWPELLDTDGDGDLDLLAANTRGGLLLLLNAGGSFVDDTASLGPTSRVYTHLLAADLDGDGRSDCAASHGSAVDVFWGGPTGLTLAPVVVQVAGVLHLFRGDFDGDGDVDLLTERAGGLDVSWNVGPRQFTASNIVPTPTVMRGVIDEDGDGCDDVAYSVAGDMGVRCKWRGRIQDAAWARRSGGIYAPRTAMLAGDVDGDGRTDLVTPGFYEVAVDHAHGDGSYHRTTSPPLPTSSRDSAELADMDGDGDRDLVLKNNAALGVATNDGSGNFAWTLLSASTTYGNDDLRIADVDADGDRDIVHAETSGVVLQRNLGGGQWAAPLLLTPGHPSLCVEVADVDGDGDPDVLAHSVTYDMLTILANDGQGNFGAATPASLGSSLMSVRAADLDGDGDVDLACTDNTSLRVRRNNGGGVFTDTSAADLPAALPLTRGNPVVGDLDSDGDLDLCVSTWNPFSLSSPGCLLLLNDGSGRFADRSNARVQRLPTDNHGLMFLHSRVLAADVDDDGDLDLTFGGTSLQGWDPAFLRMNHARHLHCNAVPRLGGVADFHLSSGPGFGAPGLALLGVDFAPVPSPLRVPGIEGNLELDPSTLQVVASTVTSPVGLSTAFVGVPTDPVLFGLELWFQGAVLPSVGAPGFTNAVYEVVLR